MPTRFPLKMHIPTDKANQPCLTLLNRQWRRLPDGSIDAVFNDRDELDLCVRVTAYLRDYYRNRQPEPEQPALFTLA